MAPWVSEKPIHLAPARTGASSRQPGGAAPAISRLDLLKVSWKGLTRNLCTAWEL